MINLPLIRTSIWGSPNLGIYLKVVGNYLLVPPNAKDKFVKELEVALNLKAVPARIYDTNLLGVFIAGNENGVILPAVAGIEEIKALESLGMELEIINSKITALGNAILANSYGALVHPGMSDEDIELIRKTLKVPVVRGRISGIPVVGSLSVITDKGGIVSPSVSDEELKNLRRHFSVEIYPGTVNDGVKFVKLGLVASKEGVAVGALTTPVEIDVITQAFGL
ncbi:MAG: translation initiation factor IF-6 [Thermoproteota archaeon]|nr:MAG: translation initiation factor IF-6 [Candidatus Korarchaeota archaeon]